MALTMIRPGFMLQRKECVKPQFAVWQWPVHGSWLHRQRQRSCCDCATDCCYFLLPQIRPAQPRRGCSPQL